MNQGVPATQYTSISNVKDSITILLKETAYQIYTTERQIQAYKDGDHSLIFNDAALIPYNQKLIRQKYKAAQFESILAELTTLEAD